MHPEKYSVRGVKGGKEKMGYEYRRNEAIIRSKTREFFGVGTVVTATSYLVPVVDFMLIGILLGADAVAAAGLGDNFVDIAELPGFVLSAGGPVAAGILLDTALRPTPKFKKTQAGKAMHRLTCALDDAVDEVCARLQ